MFCVFVQGTLVTREDDPSGSLRLGKEDRLARVHAALQEIFLPVDVRSRVDDLVRPAKLLEVISVDLVLKHLAGSGYPRL